MVLVIGGKLVFDAYEPQRRDREMLRAVEEINRKLPMSSQYVRLDRMAYAPAERMVHVSGTLLTTQALTPEGKAASHKKLKDDYCGYAPVLKANVGVEYAFAEVTLPTIDDKLREETWSVTLRPQDCL